MKLICHTQYKGLAGILDKNDKIELEIIRTTEDEIFSSRRVDKIEVDSKGIQRIVSSKFVPDVISKAGSYKGFCFKSKNGNTYNDRSLYCIIGYKSLGDVFAKA